MGVSRQFAQAGSFFLMFFHCNHYLKIHVYALTVQTHRAALADWSDLFLSFHVTFQLWTYTTLTTHLTSWTRTTCALINRPTIILLQNIGWVIHKSRLTFHTICVALSLIRHCKWTPNWGIKDWLLRTCPQNGQQTYNNSINGVCEYTLHEACNSLQDTPLDKHNVDKWVRQPYIHTENTHRVFKHG